MADLRWFVRRLRDGGRSMLGVADSYDAVTAWLLGYDAAHDGGPLNGFQEFVELRFGEPTSVGWRNLAPRAACPETWPQLTDDAKITALLDLLDEFLACVQGSLDRRRMFHEWFVMAQQKDSFVKSGADLIRYGSSPPQETLSLNEAASDLELDHAALLDLVASGRLGRTSQIGATFRVPCDAVERLRSER